MNEIQKGLLEMMIDIDAALRKAGVNYTLADGSALGAIRHKGFIPWDDDVDLSIMDYEIPKFREAMKYLPEGKYYLQDPLSVDWANSFFKIKMNGTTAIEESHIFTRMHQGLFVDVFIARKCPKPGFRRRMYMWLEYTQRGLRVLCFKNCGKPNKDWKQKILFWFYRKDLRFGEMLCRSKDGFVYMDEPTGARTVFEKPIIENTMDTEFEGHQFRIVKDYDKYLTDTYGDYMVPPPESQRVGKHLIAYDHDRDYKDWLREHYESHPEDNPYRDVKQ